MLYARLTAMFIFAYLVGGLNFSIIISRYFLKTDVRNYGSGNAGMTNSLRNFGKGIAVLVCLGDIMKSVLVFIAAKLISPDQFFMFAGAAGLILGHNFPVYYKFKGGKGMVTTGSIMVLTSPIYGTIGVAVSVGVMFATKYVSLGSLLLCVLFPITTMLKYKGDTSWLIFSVIVAALGIYMHRENIKRLVGGTENRFGRKNA